MAEPVQYPKPGDALTTGRRRIRARIRNAWLSREGLVLRHIGRRRHILTPTAAARVREIRALADAAIRGDDVALGMLADLLEEVGIERRKVLDLCSSCFTIFSTKSEADRVLHFVAKLGP